MSADTIEGHRVETPEGELFDGAQYQLPIPKKDGHQADVLRIAIAGGFDLDLLDNDALAFLNGLKLGQELELTITCRVAASTWRHAIKGEDEEEHVVHQVGLKAHSIDLPRAEQ